jgi:hypothetical protein
MIYKAQNRKNIDGTETKINIAKRNTKTKNLKT